MSDYINIYSNEKIIPIKELQNEPGAIALIGEFKDATDPKYIGPGTWNVSHRRAFFARTHEEQINFIDFMKNICYRFPCVVCKGHCTEYIKNHPMEEYLDILVEINGEKLPMGMFIWTWKFHNAVNIRTKKPVMSWDTAYNLYSETETLVCSKNCLATQDGVADGLEHENGVPILPEPKSRVLNIPVTQPTPFRLISNRK